MIFVMHAIVNTQIGWPSSISLVQGLRRITDVNAAVYAGGQVFSFGLSDDVMDWESGDTIPIWHLEDQLRWRRAE